MYVVDMSLEQWESTFSRDNLNQLPQTTAAQREREGERLGSTTDEVGQAMWSQIAVSFLWTLGRSSCDEFSVLIAMMYRVTMTLKNEIVNIAPRGRVNSVLPGIFLRRVNHARLTLLVVA